MAQNPTVPEIPALRGSRGLFYGWFAVAAASILCFIQHWKRYERVVQELSRLSDRELADIGITRGDIDRIASG